MMHPDCMAFKDVVSTTSVLEWDIRCSMSKVVWTTVPVPVWKVESEQSISLLAAFKLAEWQPGFQMLPDDCKNTE